MVPSLVRPCVCAVRDCPWGSGRGDLVVNISVYVPKTLSKEEKHAIEQFKDSDNFKGDKQTRDSIFQKFKNYFN